MLTKFQWFVLDFGALAATSLAILSTVVLPIDVAFNVIALNRPQPLWFSLILFAAMNVPGFVMIFMLRLNTFWVLEFILGKAVGEKPSIPRRSFRYFCRWI